MPTCNLSPGKTGATKRAFRFVAPFYLLAVGVLLVLLTLILSALVLILIALIAAVLLALVLGALFVSHVEMPPFPLFGDRHSLTRSAAAYTVFS